MIDILNLIPGTKRRTASGWVSFNAVCCHHRGHKADKKGRGGVIITDVDSWNYHCFNCHFKCGSSTGKQFSKNTKMLLEWCGVDRMQIERWSFQNFSNKSLYDVSEVVKPIIVKFEKKELPEGSELLDSTNPLHSVHVDYLAARGLSSTSYHYYVTPNDESERCRNRIIIPYYYSGDIVGYTSRFYDGRAPKYVSEQQRGYVFNIDNQHEDWQTCILVEGQFDAIAIGGCAYMSNTILDEQAYLLKKLRREIIVVPDRDKPGMEVCDRALDLGYRVSIPEWSSEVKDVNDAVRKYGRLATTLSILEAATSSKITIEMKRRNFK